ncbi:hypothetical protein [Neorhizobium sp. NCHU2750]|uniref:hypothetical protein n=1 Tax=Neorhizobium sp. NCHU2750 TaxID=1825976 RepID=UPI000E73355E|nr:hypothetical protein NCHU2750_23400 [Neorhizobium sp. NCHU2750]
MNHTAISAIFLDAVNAEEAITADTVRTAALKTLHDLMTDEYVPHAIRTDIAKYIIETHIG